MLKYKDYDVELVWGQYENGNVALQLVSDEDGPVATVSVNPGQQAILSVDLIAVKNYSENTGMVDWLLTNGIIQGDVIAVISSGFVSIPVYELTDEYCQ